MKVKYKEIVLYVDYIDFNFNDGFSAICYLHDRQYAFLNNIDATQLSIEDNLLSTPENVCLTIPEQE